MVEKSVKKDLACDTEASELLLSDEGEIQNEEATKLYELEKNFLKMFGILLQLIVFYLPILSLVVRFGTQPQGILC